MLYEHEPLFGVLYQNCVDSVLADAPFLHFGDNVLQQMAITMTAITNLKQVGSQGQN